LLERQVIGWDRDAFKSRSQRTETGGVRIFGIGITKMDDLFGPKFVAASADAVLVEIDDVAAVGPAFRRDILRRQNPNVLRHTQGTELKIPVGAAVNLLIQRRQLPQVEATEDRIHLAEE